MTDFSIVIVPFFFVVVAFVRATAFLAFAAFFTSELRDDFFTLLPVSRTTKDDFCVVLPVFCSVSSVTEAPVIFPFSSFLSVVFSETLE